MAAARKGFSERAWDEIINGDMEGDWVDGVIEEAKKRPDDPFADSGPLLEAMLKRGVTKEQIARLARHIKYETVFETVQLAAEEELDGDQLEGVHEELLMSDPSGKDGRPGSWPIEPAAPPRVVDAGAGKKGAKSGKAAKVAASTKSAKAAKAPASPAKNIKPADPDAPLLKLPKGDDFAFAPDGARLWLAHTSVSSSTVRGVELPGGGQFAEFNALPNLRGLACSPDGTRLFAANHYGVTALYDSASGKQLWTSPKTNEEPYHVAYAPDASVVFNAGSEPLVRRRDAKTGKELPPLDFGEGWLSGEMAFAPDGKTLAVLATKVCGPTDVTYWDWRGAKELRRHKLREAGASAIAFLPGGRSLLAVGYRAVDMFDVKSGKRTGGFKVERAKGGGVHPSGRLLALDTYEDGSQIRELPSGRLVKRLETNEMYPEHIVFSPDGAHLLLVASPRSFLWNVQTLLGRRVTP